MIRAAGVVALLTRCARATADHVQLADSPESDEEPTSSPSTLHARQAARASGPTAAQNSSYPPRSMLTRI